MGEQKDNTILSDVKKFLGLNPDEPDEFFDSIIIDAINTSISEIAQLGLLNLGDFIVETGDESWSDYLGIDNMYIFSFAKNYIQVNSKLIVDPPQSGSLSSSLEEKLKKATHNIQTAVELHNISEGV